MPNAAQVSANFWNSSPSRKEMQQVFEEYSQVVAKMQEKLAGLDLAIAFLTDKFDVAPAEVQAFVERKVQALSMLQAEQAAAQPVIEAAN